MPNQTLFRLVPMALAAAALEMAALAAAPPLALTLSRSGDATLRRTDTEAIVATVKPGLFEATWQYRGVTARPSGAAGSSETEGVAQVAGGKSVVKVRGEAKPEGTKVRFRYVLTPEAAISVNSVHVSVNLPVARWVGARFTGSGGAAGTVPTAPKNVQLVSGDLRSLALEKEGASVRVESEGQPLMLQDNRVFNGSDLEIRIGRQTGEGRSWPAGQAETIAFSVDFGAPVTVEREAPVTLSAGPDWVPLDLKLDVAAGSALDLSSLNEAPAGKQGRVIARPDGHFGFERGSGPVRFYGANLCFSANYLEKKEADRLAERMARAGYNTVRVHHYEGELVDGQAPDSLTFRPDRLDRLDYLVAALKKRGIYLTTDLFVSRPVRASESPGGDGDDYKMALLVSDRALANWKAFSGKLLRHVNPYTGVAWKDDPAVAWLSLVNEPNAIGFLGRLQGELLALFEGEWRQWLKERYRTDSALAAAWNDPRATLAAPLPKSVDNSSRGRDTAEFLTALHVRAYDRMAAFLKQEGGTKALLTYLNGWSETPAFMEARTHFDYVDNHFYWDHPRFLASSWQLPSEGGSGGGSAITAGGAGPGGVAATRLWGKPFAVSEYNYSAPNPYRAEGGLLMGAAAALQDWDAVWRFAYSHSREAVSAPRPLDYFNMATDPAGMSSEFAAAMLFRRGDLSPAAETAVVSSTPEELRHRTAKSVPTDRIWNAVLGREIAAKGEKPPATRLSRPAGPPGAVALDAENGVLRIDTPRFAAAAAPAGRWVTAGALTAKIEGARAVVWAASLDGKPLAQSRRLLLVHATDVQNSGMRYAGPDRRVLLDWGTLPHLARAGTAEVSLTGTRPGSLKAWRLDTAGNRLSPIPVRKESGRIALHLTTRAEDGKATLYYEIAPDPR